MRNNKTFNSFKWSAIERIIAQFMQLFVVVVLARILGPQAFGLVALIMVFISIAQVFIDGGVLIALVRQDSCTERDYTTAFYFNIAIGLLTYAILIIIAFPLSGFYEDERIKSLLILMGSSLLFNALSIVQKARLTRELDFKTQAKASIISVFIAGLISIVMALYNYGVWALVVQYITMSFISTSILYYYSPWHPKGKFSSESFKRLYGFSYKLLLSGLIDTIYKNIYPLIIGKFFNATSVGFFNQARQLSSVPATTLTTIIQRVTFPLLSKHQNDENKLDKDYLLMLRMSAAVIFPIMIGLSLISDSLIVLLLGKEWFSIIPYFCILCWAYSFYPVHAINLNLIHVKGRSDIFLRLEILKKIVATIILIISLEFGIKGICYGLLCMSLFELFANTYYTQMLSTITMWVQFKKLGKMYVICFISAVVAYYFCCNLSPSILKMLFSLSIALSVYSALIFFFERDLVYIFRGFFLPRDK